MRFRLNLPLAGRRLAAPGRGRLRRLRLARFRLRIAPIPVWRARGWFGLRLDLQIWFGRRRRRGRRLASSQLLGRLGHNRRSGKLHFGRCEGPARFLGGRFPGLGLHRSPLLAGFLNFLAPLGELLSFGLGHRLESHGAVFTLGQLVNGRCDQPTVRSGLRRARIYVPLGGPGARRPRGFMIAAILVGRFHAVCPLAVPTMLPALMRINRVVAIAAGLERKRCVESALVVARGIIVPEIVVAVARPQEEMVAEYAQIDYDGGRVEVTAPGIHTGFKINRREEHAAPGHRVIPEATDENVSARGPNIMGGHPIPIRPALHPITRPPSITPLIPDPTSGRPTVIN